MVYQDPNVTDIACAGLNGMRMGERTLTVRRATEVRAPSALLLAPCRGYLSCSDGNAPTESCPYILASPSIGLLKGVDSTVSAQAEGTEGDQGVKYGCSLRRLCSCAQRLRIRCLAIVEGCILSFVSTPAAKRAQSGDARASGHDVARPEPARGGVTVEELQNDEEYNDIVEDMREECSKVCGDTFLPSVCFDHVQERAALVASMVHVRCGLLRWYPCTDFISQAGRSPQLTRTSTLSSRRRRVAWSLATAQPLLGSQARSVSCAAGYLS